MTQPKQALDTLLAGADRMRKQREAAIESSKIIAAEREAARQGDGPAQVAQP